MASKRNPAPKSTILTTRGVSLIRSALMQDAEPNLIDVNRTTLVNALHHTKTVTSTKSTYSPARNGPRKDG